LIRLLLLFDKGLKAYLVPCIYKNYTHRNQQDNLPPFLALDLASLVVVAPVQWFEYRAQR
jgi:hypothetical protein